MRKIFVIGLLLLMSACVTERQGEDTQGKCKNIEPAKPCVPGETYSCLRYVNGCHKCFCKKEK